MLFKTKKLAAEKAVSFIKNNSTIGLGTGSTAFWAIAKIGERIKNESLQIQAVATSKRSQQQAEELNIPIVNFSEINKIDITIDGADEADENFNLIKGGGGALFREKIVAYNSSECITIIDETKLVQCLGKFALPVEVGIFAWDLTLKNLRSLNCAPQLRMENNKPFITDNNNYIIDCAFEKIINPPELHNKINSIVGVVENGLFVNMTNKIIIGYETGDVKILQNKKLSG